MILPRSPATYSPRDQNDIRATLEREDQQNLKRGTDIEIGAASLILTSPDGERWAVVVDNAGALSATAL